FAVAPCLPRRPGLTQLNHLVASLFAQGVALRPDYLYARRRPRRVDLGRPLATPQVPALAVGFPEMRLSPGLAERLRGRELRDVRRVSEAQPTVIAEAIGGLRSADPPYRERPAPEQVGQNGHGDLDRPAAVASADAPALAMADSRPALIRAHLRTMDE